MNRKHLSNDSHFLAAILDSIQDGVSVLAPDLTVLYTNRVMEQWYQASMPLVGKKCHVVYHQSESACHPCPTLRCLESGGMEMEIVQGLPGSQAQWLELFAFPMKDETTRRVTAVVEYVRDITARVEAQRALDQKTQMLASMHEIDRAILSAHSVDDIIAASLHRIRKVLGATRVSLASLNPDGRSATVQGVSETVEIPVTIGQTVPLETFGPPDQGDWPIGWIDDLAKWPHMTPIHEQILASGIRSVMLVPLRYTNDLLAVLNVGYDKPHAISQEHKDIAEEITTQLALALHQARLTEHIRRHNEELEANVAERTRQIQASNEAFEEFAYSVSHDLRAPLRAIRGFAEIIARRHRDSLDEEGRHYFDNIVEAAGRMSHLISDLLAYSRLGKSALPPRPVPLSKVLTEVLSRFDAAIAKLQAEVIVPHTLPTVMAHPTLLEQIFLNLIDNALKYRRIDVAPRIEITTQASKGDLVISVADNGMGIAAKHFDKIFNIFQRLHSQEDYPGTGIGLATVKRAAQRLGGLVEVTSKVGEGSVFSLRLPETLRVER